MAARFIFALLLAVSLVEIASATYRGYIGYVQDTCKTPMKLVCTDKTNSVKLEDVTSCSTVSAGCYFDGKDSKIAAQNCMILFNDLEYRDDGDRNAKKYTSCPKCAPVKDGKGVELTCAAPSANADCNNPVAGRGVCGDPHFSAPGGILFDWSGIREQTFSIISDTDLQVNAHFIGERENSGNVEHGTWIQEIAMGYMDGDDVHFLSVGLDEDKDFETKDVFYFTFDGEDIPVGSGTAEYKWTSPDGRSTVVRAAHQRAQAHVKIEGLFEATFYPRVESRIQLDPLGKFLDMDMEDLRLSRHSHGVLGQMFRPDVVERKNAVTSNATGHDFLVEGKTEDYRVSSLQSYDSLFNQFNLAAGMKIKSFSFVDTARKMLSSSSGQPIEEPLRKFSAQCAQESGSLVCI